MAYRMWTILDAIAYFKAVIPDALANQVLECMTDDLDGNKGLDMSVQGGPIVIAHASCRTEY